MPGSLLSRVRRNDSTRSDKSDVSADSWKSSGKKVSFNRAVRVKKFPRRVDALHDDPGDIENKRFWFNVYKNKGNGAGDSLNSAEHLGDSINFDAEDNEAVITHVPSFSPITESSVYRKDLHNASEMRLSADVGVGTSEGTVHSRQQNGKSSFHRNHVRQLVTKFNDEARVKYYDDQDDLSPTIRIHNTGRLEPPVDYTENSRQGHGKNTLSNGVKGIYGVSDEGETKRLDLWRKNDANLKKSFSDYESDDGPPYRTHTLLSNKYANSKSKNDNSLYNRNHVHDEKDGQLELFENERNLLPLHFWDSGDQLVSDVSRYESTVDRDDEGQQVHKTVEEGSKVWKHETRTVYEQEDPPSHSSERRKTKSHGDLRERKESANSHSNNRKLFSNDYLSDRSRNDVTKDRAVQCNRSKGSVSNSSSASTRENSHRLIRSSQDGSVTAYSDVPSLKLNGTSSHIKKQEDTLSQINSNNQKLIGKKSASNLSLNSKSGKIKSSQKSFGFRLKKAFGATLPEDRGNENTYTPAKDEDGKWYDIDADVLEADERAKGHHDISEVRHELEDRKNENGYAKNDTTRKDTKGSVVREVDLRKREIVYENTPLRNRTEARAEAGGLCYREAREDYRRGMAKSDPNGKRVGSTSTLGRSWLNKSRDSPPKVYTLDGKPPRPPTTVNGTGKSNGSTVKIHSNGHEIEDMNSPAGKRNTTRGGLAAAFKARQKAALKQTDSLSGSRHSVSNLGFSSGASSTVSSEGEASRRRQAQVVYIPAVDNSRSDSDDRRSGLSRTQSLYAISKPPTKHQKQILKNGTLRRHPSNRNVSDFPRVQDEEKIDTLTPLRSDTAKDENSSKTNKKGELYRRHSMPKDSKFGWLKWKIKSEDKRESGRLNQKKNGS